MLFLIKNGNDLQRYWIERAIEDLGLRYPLNAFTETQVNIVFADDPLPSFHNEAAGTSKKDLYWETRIAANINDPDFLYDILAHEVAHVLIGVIGIKPDDARAVFGAPPNAPWHASDIGSWPDAVEEATAETFKDIFSPRRKYANRTKWQLPYTDEAIFAFKQLFMGVEIAGHREAEVLREIPSLRRMTADQQVPPPSDKYVEPPRYLLAQDFDVSSVMDEWCDESVVMRSASLGTTVVYSGPASAGGLVAEVGAAILCYGADVAMPKDPMAGMPFAVLPDRNFSHVITMNYPPLWWITSDPSAKPYDLAFEPRDFASGGLGWAPPAARGGSAHAYWGLDPRPLGSYAPPYGNYRPIPPEYSPQFPEILSPYPPAFPDDLPLRLVRTWLTVRHLDLARADEARAARDNFQWHTVLHAYGSEVAPIVVPGLDPPVEPEVDLTPRGGGWLRP